MKVYGGSWSDIGQRTMNQDAIVYKQYERDGNFFVVCAVCDGVGGLEHGELAATYLANSIESWFDTVTGWLDFAELDTGILFAHLKDAAEEWNEGVRNLCIERQMRMGSTLSILMIVKQDYYIVHVGDSRIYHYFDSLERLTLDASVSRVKNGRIKNFLSNFMGKSEELFFQALQGKISGREMFIVCSDGFYHHLTEKDVIELYYECMQYGQVMISCKNMVERMLSRGETDNTSLGVVMIQ